MPNWGEIEQLGEAAVKAVGENPTLERFADEVMSTAARAVGSEAPAAARTSVTAREFIATAVQRGEMPSGLYKNADSFAFLRDPRTVTVDNRFISNNRIWLKREAADANGWKNTGVYLNGERLGIFDRQSSIAKETFPLNVRSVHLSLSDNTTVAIPERDVQVIERWNHELGRSWPDKKMALSSQPVRISPFTTLSFADASALRPGTKLITEFPFQQLGGELTNGVWRFPLDAQRGILPSNLGSLPEEHYQQFLTALEGKTVDEAVLPDWIKFNGKSGPVATREAMVNSRPQIHVESSSHGYAYQLPRLRYFDQLEGGQTVSVDSVDVAPHAVSLKLDPRDGQWLDHGVYVDGTRVGAFDKNAGLSRYNLPTTISTATVKLSDGRALSVSDRALRVVGDWGAPDAHGRFNPTLNTVFDTAPVALSPLDRFSFTQAKALQPGTTFTFDHPFQEFNGRLTNGFHELPLRRSTGQFSDIPEDRWQELLNALKGKRASEAVLPDWAKLSEFGGPKFDDSIRIKERPLAVHVSKIDFSSQLKPQTPPAVLRRLTGGESVTVDSVTLAQHNLSLHVDPPSGEWLDQGVYINGERVGAFDRNGGIDRHEFPLTVQSAQVKLSNGETFAVSERPLRVINRWGTPDARGFAPTYKTALSSDPISTTPWETLSYEGASQLKAGDQLVQRYPFQWVDENLTNGSMSLPRVRPEGAEWRKYPIPAVPKGYYDSYLRTLEGTFVDDVVAAHPRIVTGVENERAIERLATRSLSERQFEMWNGVLADGDKKVDYVSLSHGVIFKVPAGANKTVYVVDNPGSGAIYLFKEYANAEKLATNFHTLDDAMEGKGARTIARDAGNRFVIHRGDWKEKLAQAINDLATEIPASPSSMLGSQLSLPL